ncbi:hypothetical protein EXIGLDRAFT_698482 [Exidia glandulosa HHB12029]|uniref:Uncharacterized protein n=1 Tax=Exidia glandulosa HHB12029 TaxID=1314781 RepID=A0A165E9S2_EXIGL|nr:hypothetical protein EXIGLDRAFT_698482 [Exidia glandulosa HHB12029]
MPSSLFSLTALVAVSFVAAQASSPLAVSTLDTQCLIQCVQEDVIGNYFPDVPCGSLRTDSSKRLVIKHAATRRVLETQSLHESSNWSAREAIDILIPTIAATVSQVSSMLCKTGKGSSGMGRTMRRSAPTKPQLHRNVPILLAHRLETKLVTEKRQEMRP